MSSFDPRSRGAQCDRCPLGPKGCLSRGDWTPVESEVHEGATVAAVLEAPKKDDLQYGIPLSGLDGGEWDRALKANNLHRTLIDLFFVVACSPVDGWKKVEASRRRRRQKRVKALRAHGKEAAEAKQLAEAEHAHPAHCWGPSLLAQPVGDGQLLALSRTASPLVLLTTGSMPHL